MKRRTYDHADYLKYENEGGICFYCKEATEYDHITVDHVLPRNRGFLLVNNSVFACRFCNTKKCGLTIYQFREYLCRLFAFYVRKNSGQPICNKVLMAIKTCTELLNDKTSILYSEKLKHGRGRKSGKQKPYIPQKHDIIKPPFNGYKDVHISKLISHV